LVLVVEDDGDVRGTAVEALRRHGYLAASAADGAQALQLIAAMRESGLPDVIVLDLMMPVMDGYAFLAARAELPELAAIPVVIASAAPPSRDLASSTWNELLRKPFDLDTLVVAVDRARRRK